MLGFECVLGGERKVMVGERVVCVKVEIKEGGVLEVRVWFWAVKC